MRSNTRKTSYIRTAGNSMPNAGVSNIGSTENGFNVYPNPSNGDITMLCTTPGSEPIIMTITSMIGARVKQLTIPANTPYHIALDEPAGVYIISAQTANNLFTNKIVLAH